MWSLLQSRKPQKIAVSEVGLVSAKSGDAFESISHSRSEFSH